MAEGTGLRKDYDKNIENKEIKEIKTNDTEKIRERIEETRLEMGETIQEIEERLSLENISEQVSEKVSEKASEAYETAKDKVYDATVNKAGKFMKTAGKEIKRSSIYETVTENPFPLFLITLGAGLLFFKGKNKSSRRTSSAGRRHLSGYEEETSSTLKSAGRKISETAGSAYETAADKASSISDQVGDAAVDTYDAVERYGTKALDQYEYYVDENPLAVGAVALAVGALVGLAIPATRYENNLMGETREDVISSAKDAVSEKVEQVKAVAGDATGAIREDAAEKAKKLADNAVDIVGDKVRDEGLA